MLRENKERQNSFYSALYEKIPESHILKQIDKAVDFSFINDLLESSYCKHFGRPAKEPEMMMKLLFLQYIYNLSDVKVIEEANCTKKVPERIMKHLAKRIFKSLEADNGAVPEEINTNTPDYTQIEDHKQAKTVMKDYLEETIASAEEYAGEETEKAIAEAKDVLSDEKFILQKGLRSLSDKDARVGNKSKTQQFYGYKAEYTMTADERIITAMDIHTGEYVDGKEFSTLLEKTVKTGAKVSELYGDKAYFRKGYIRAFRRTKDKRIYPRKCKRI